MSINSVVNDTVTGESVINALKPKPPTITGYAISGADDTALDPAGGQTILLNGTGFQRGATVTLNGNAISVVTYVDANQLSFTSPAVSAGTYTIYAVNADGGTGIYIPGLIYSNLPTWTTSAGSLGSYYETQTLASNVVASGDAPVTYSLFSGALPTGAVFNANGTISGSAPVDSGSTTYSFTVRATDAQLQDSTRSFSLTINTDVVSWTTPNASATYTTTVNSVMANIGLTATSAAGSAVTYSANSLPTGVSLSGNTISGTPTSTGSSSTLLTATATATSRTATRTINWTIAVAADTYFKNTTLLLPGASTTFVKDASSNNFAVTIAGDTKPNSFNPYTPGYYSNYFDGTGDYLTVPASTALAPLTGDFTYECWVYPTSSSVSYRAIFGIDNYGGGQPFRLYQYGTQFQYWYTGSATEFIGSSTITINTWYHLAITRSSGVVKFFVNGTQAGNNVTSTLNYPSSIFRIGMDLAGSYPFVGYISNLRAVKGTAIYTANFTPSTTPLTAISGTSLLICQSNRFIDNSTNNFTVTVAGDTKIQSFQPFTPNNSYSTYGSAYFDGTGDYLSVSNTNLALNTGDFTLECWINADTGLSDKGIFEGRTSGSGTTGFTLTAITPTTIRIWSGSALITSGTISYVKTWCHVAVVRLSGTTTLYINGVSQGTTTSLGNLTDSSFVVGAGRYAGPPNVDAFFTGYISDFRIVKGTAVYTTNFTPPAAPLTAVAGTSLLTLQNNQPTNNSVFLDSSSNNFSVTRNGNATQGSFSPYYGENWSNYFDGTGDSLSFVPGAFGANNFTIEFWMYTTSSSQQTIFNNWRWFNGQTPGAIAFIYETSKIYAYVATGGGNDNISAPQNSLSSATVSIVNKWTHISLTRSGGTIYLGVDGVIVSGALTSNTALNMESTQTTYVIGQWQYNGGGPAWGYTGYISNFRIVKGTALYTADYTVPTAPLTAITGTNILTCNSGTIVDKSASPLTITKAGDVSVTRLASGPFSPTESYSAITIGGSGYFDGTGDYLTLSPGASFAFGTGDFTVEAWIYPASFGSSGFYIVDARNSGQTTNWAFGVQLGGVPNCLSFYDGVSTVDQTTQTIVLNTWNHVAACRTGSTLSIYANGTRVATGSNSTNLNVSPTTSYIGSRYSQDGGLNGYMSGLRIVKGTAVYSGASITPPTTPVTAVTNTSLLLNFTGAGVYDASMMNNLETVGDAKLSTAVSKFGGSSMSFDGTGDSVSTSTFPAFGTGDFTVETWFYLTSAGDVYPQPVAAYDGTYGPIIRFGNNGFGNKLQVMVNPATLATVWSCSLTQSSALNTWYHAALVRQSGVCKFYLNGVLQNLGSGANPSTYPSTSFTSTESVGVSTMTVGSGFTGYIDDLRITRGYARYTANFTPPTEAFMTK